MGPRFLQSKIHSDYSTGSANWSEYRDQIKALYDASVSKMDFNDHLIREYNRKIDRLNQEAGLYITPFDGGFRFIGTSISSLFPEAALDFNFAEDRTIVPRVGPTPTFGRFTSATYFGPNRINVEYTYAGNTYNVNLSQDAIVNGKWQWRDGDTEVYFSSPNWLLTHDSNLVATSASTTSWRPDDADWTGTSATVTTGNTFSIVGAAIDEPRFEYDPVTFECLGLLLEKTQTTNRIFPSDTLTTQTRTTNSTSHTLSFYGTGTVVLSGTHSATVVGISDTIRQVYKFTPTSGSLTLTVTGSVKFAQLERSSSLTSYVRTTTGIATRQPDIMYIPFSSLYDKDSGNTFFIEKIPIESFNQMSITYGESENQLSMTLNTNSSATAFNAAISFDSVSQFSESIGTYTLGVVDKSAFAFENDNAIICYNGVLGTQDNDVTLPTVNGAPNLTFDIGVAIFSSFRFYKQRISNQQLQTLTTL